MEAFNLLFEVVWFMILIIIGRIVRRIAFIIPSMMQPLRLGVTIIGLRIFSCLLVGFEFSRWYGYIIFLIYVGGLLVIFRYVAALRPNNFFSGVKNLILFISRFFVFLTVFFRFFFINNMKLLNLNLENYEYKERITGILICSSYNVGILIFLGIVLLLALVAVVKICFQQQAPLRPYG